jgi:hypothetical protein
MRTLGVIPFDPLGDGSTSLGKAGEVVLPNTLLFQAAKEAFDNAVLFRGIRSDKLRAQLVIAAGGAKPPALENQPVITSHHRGRTVRPQRTEARQAGFLERVLGFLGATAQRELETGDAVMAIDDCGQLSSAISAARHMSYIHRPCAHCCVAPGSSMREPAAAVALRAD